MPEPIQKPEKAAKKAAGKMGFLLSCVEFLLLVLAIALACAWRRYPDRHMDVYLAISVAVVALLDWLRRTFKEEPEQRKDKEKLQGFERDIRTALDDLRRLTRKQQEQPRPAPAAAPPPSPSATERAAADFTAILGFRDRINAGIKEIAQAHQIEIAGRNAEELLSVVPMVERFRKGIEDYLKTTSDLTHLDEATREWAMKNGPMFAGTVDMLVRNARTPAP
ncbi:MAG TPA: hypothetical protein VHX11_08485 [Acidobacteriaceae bacterium]|jgi:hypothetical protein|nr:hypothetical protein [Acidobacteriaceae bacterium]